MLLCSICIPHNITVYNTISQSQAYKQYTCRCMQNTEKKHFVMTLLFHLLYAFVEKSHSLCIILPAA